MLQTNTMSQPLNIKPKRTASGFMLILLVLTLVLTTLTNLVITRQPGAVTASGKPNVVMIVTDDQTFDSLQYMPYISSLTDWVKFKNAVMPTSLCCPARTTILTGQYPSHTGIQDNKGPQNFKDSNTLATWLHSAGYQTGMIGKYLNLFPWGKGSAYVPPGWDTFSVYSAFDDNSDTAGYYNYTLAENGSLVTYGSTATDYSTDVFTNKAVQFIQNVPDGKPFFLNLTPHAPHTPDTPAPRHAGYYNSLPITHTPDFNEADVSDKPPYVQALLPYTAKKIKKTDAKLRQTYESLLAVDDQVKAVFDALNTKGVADNTVVMFMTDNGYSYASHRLNGKRCEYEYCVRSPLLIHYPGNSGAVYDQMVSTVDIAATVSELAGVTPGLPQDGRSLVPFLTGQAPADWSTAALLQWKGDSVQGTGFMGLRTNQYKYVELYPGKVASGSTTKPTFFELYDLATDPYELENVANNPAYADIKSSLAAQLYSMETSSGLKLAH